MLSTQFSSAGSGSVRGAQKKWLAVDFGCGVDVQVWLFLNFAAYVSLWLVGGHCHKQKAGLAHLGCHKNEIQGTSQRWILFTRGTTALTKRPFLSQAHTVERSSCLCSFQRAALILTLCALFSGCKDVRVHLSQGENGKGTALISPLEIGVL